MEVFCDHLARPRATASFAIQLHDMASHHVIVLGRADIVRLLNIDKLDWWSGCRLLS